MHIVFFFLQRGRKFFSHYFFLVFFFPSLRWKNGYEREKSLRIISKSALFLFRHADFIGYCWWDHFDVANISNSIVALVDRSKWEPIFFFGSLVLLKLFKGYINFFNQNTFIIFCHHSRVFLHQIIFCSYVTYQFEELNDLSVENKNFSPKEIGVELYFIEVRLRILPTDSSE